MAYCFWASHADSLNFSNYFGGVNMIDKTQTVFPIVNPDGDYREGERGLNKREYFAIMALQGILAANEGTYYDSTIKECINYADALIEALNNG